ncbi:HTH XRE domain-containing protein [Bodo saltans virus]|jgi:ribosome-binding protein aMBF1 (putative translation factor)|uniref:HTH XRE domain-containing protein n=1 Tax=Bodo saltans virus TaxID=2024608 RepID=A0A2H4UVS6_9VIRU|nr:HTH XRE domain-containing protein [Bodo saltans virus]ATZ81032.1 HTH XRE domain-containing protein [Bodo saltans virus]
MSKQIHKQIVTFPVDPPKGQPVKKEIKIVKPEDVRDDNDIKKLHTVKPDISRRIVSERTKLGWTQNDLAKQSCVNINIIKNYENGTAVIDGKIQQSILVTLEKESKKRKDAVSV